MSEVNPQVGDVFFCNDELQPCMIHVTAIGQDKALYKIQGNKEEYTARISEFSEWELRERKGVKLYELTRVDQQAGIMVEL